MRLIDRLRVVRRWGRYLSIAGAVALLSVVASADDPCTKGPDLWLPPDGTVGLAGGGVSVQETTGDVCQGGEVTITVTVDNLSCGDAGPFDVTVTYDGGAGLIGTRRVDGLPGCEYTVLTFQWDTTHVPVGEHDIVVCADSGGVVDELNESNNCLTLDTELWVLPNEPMIEAEKTLTGMTYEPGTEVRYEVTIYNDGCADMPDGKGHEFVDELPGGVAATGHGSATSGTLDVVVDKVVWDGEIPSGGSVTLVYTVTVDGNPTDEICNQGIAYWDADGDGTNESSERTDNPATPIDDDPTCFIVSEGPKAPPLSGTIDAPTLSEWGIILVSCLFVIAFMVKVRRRNGAAA